ncbi:unnamed protein product [Orchesella dallaii]|uniref:DUF243 domain-containing protein n=1 Tax=Orchesella dallaii TaxID=48710 RepID=A0ABP1RI60_9HEXA
MKTLLIFASALSIAYAGVGTLSPSEEAEALNLFNRLCNGYNSEGQVVGGTRVYCKRGSGEISESRNHRVSIPGQSGSGQTVFIQPPAARYHHNVEIVAGGGEGDRTKIYVLPQQATHTINPNIQQTPGTQNKPVVYFLKGGSSSGSSSGSNQGSYGPPPSNTNYGAPPSKPNYGAPPSQTNYGPPASKPVGGAYGAPAVKPAQGSYGAPAVNTPTGGYVAQLPSHSEALLLQFQG